MDQDGLLPFRENLQLRLLLKHLEKTDKITQTDAKKLIHVISETGEVFLPITINQRQELERRMERLLQDSNRERLENQVWNLRARFAKGHSLARSCLQLDCYADEIKQGESLKLIHAFLLALGESP